MRRSSRRRGVAIGSAAGVVALLASCVPPGGVDPTFGTNGVARIETGAGAQFARIALTPDGEVIVAAVAEYTSNIATLFVTRLHGDGTLDPSFGNSGSTTEAFATPGGSIENITVQADGKILVFEELEQGVNALVRLDANGALDTSFANKGTFWPSSMYGGSVAFVPGTKPTIVVVGRTPDLGYVRLEGLNVDGSPDPNFGVDGVFDFQWAGSGSNPGQLEVGPGGRLLLPGIAYVRNGVETDDMAALAVLTRDGQFDPHFAGGGRVIFQETSSVLGASAAFDPSGRILLTLGNRTVERLLADGSLDMSYGTNGVAPFPAAPPNFEQYPATIFSDGAGRAVLVSGIVSRVGPCNEACQPVATVARLTASGATDTTFAHGTGLAILSAYRRADDAVVTPNGLLLVMEPPTVDIIRVGL